MKKTTGILSAVALALLLWAVALWLLPFGGYKKNMKETRYGLNEGMEVVEQIVAQGQLQYVVEDAQGNTLFRIPLRGCMIDTRFRGGRLRFREMATGREGYVDTNGMVTFTAGAAAQTKAVVPEDELTRQNMDMENQSVESAGPSDSKSRRESKGHAVKLTQTDIRKIAQSSPFYNEAAKILKGKLTETDASRRRQILNYCEHLRTAYTTKDIDFLRQVFSDEALIIVGNVVKESATTAGIGSDSRVTYALHTKRDYLATRQGVRRQQDSRREVLRLPHHAPSYERRHLRRFAAPTLHKRPLLGRRLAVSAVGLPQSFHAAHTRANVATVGNRRQFGRRDRHLRL